MKRKRILNALMNVSELILGKSSFSFGDEFDD